MKKVYEYNVFLASPSDVSERAEIDKVIERVHEMLGSQPIRLKLLRWEDVPAGYSPSGPQARIYDYFNPERWDVVLGIFHKKIGEPREELGGLTPTEHEIKTALRLRKDGGRPEVQLYFARTPAISPNEAEEFYRLMKLRKGLEKEVILKEFGPGQLASVIELDLLRNVLALHERRQPFQKEASIEVDVKASCRHIRAEGVTERVGDLALIFSGNHYDGEVHSGYFDLEIRTSPAVNITSPLFGSQIDVTLRMDRNSSRVLYAKQVFNNCISFENVTLDLKSNRCKQTMLVEKLRVNASQIGVPFGQVTPIHAIVVIKSKTGQASQFRIFEPAPTVGFASCGASFYACSEPDFGLPGTLQGSVNAGVTDEVLSAWQEPPFFRLRFTEGGLSIFKSRLEERPEVEPNVAPASGTRFIVRFSGVPAGLRVFVSIETLLSSNARFVRTDPNGAGGQMMDRDDGYVEVEMFGGYGTAVWEWTAPANYSETRSADFGVILKSEIPTSTSGECFVAGTLGPVSTVATANDSSPIPRFVDTSAKTLLFRYGPLED